MVDEPDVGVYAPYATETTDTTHYIGVSPEYMTYADVSSQPFADEDDETLNRLKSQSAVAKVAPPESNPTLGGGSLGELVYSAVSGEGYTAQVVDQAEVYEEQKEYVEEAQEDQDTQFPTNVKPAGPVPFDK